MTIDEMTGTRFHVLEMRAMGRLWRQAERVLLLLLLLLMLFGHWR